MRRFDAIIWDLDGTLVETRQDIAKGVNLLLADRGLQEMPLSQVVGHVGRGTRVLISRCLADRGVTSLTDEELDQAHDQFRDHYSEHLLDTSLPYPGIPDLLSRLSTAGVVMGVVSNKPVDFTRRIIDGLDMSRFFLVVLGGDSLPERKPHPAPLLHVLDEVDVSAADALMVGDMTLDVEAARAAGMAVATVAWGFMAKQNLLEPSPDLIAESPAILGEWILG